MITSGGARPSCRNICGNFQGDTIGILPKDNQAKWMKSSKTKLANLKQHGDSPKGSDRLRATV